ncbi:MAG: hypothetical protein HPY67_03095 [Syntrophaceae bacterium]|nr:hypothetical protein [Syntrophaceae bacterium]
MNHLSHTRPSVRATLIGCALLLALSAFSPAHGAERKSVEAEGIAAIQGSNLAQARDRAMTQALRGAIEKTLRTFIPAEALAGRQAVLDEKIFPSAERYVVHYRILREAEQDGAYAVRIAATVDVGGLRGDLRRHGISGAAADETGGSEQQLVLAVRGAFASHHDYLVFRDLLAGIPGVQRVTPVSIAPELCEWRLHTSEGAAVIARELSRRKFKGTPLRIVQSDAEGIVATFNGKGGLRD